MRSRRSARVGRSRLRHPQARERFAGDGRVAFVHADLEAPLPVDVRGAARLPEREIHWMRLEIVARLSGAGAPSRA